MLSGYGALNSHAYRTDLQHMRLVGYSFANHIITTTKPTDKYYVSYISI